MRFTMESIDDLQSEAYGVVRAYADMWPIGKLLVSYSTTPTEGAIAHGLVTGESFLRIDDLVIRQESWRKLGIGSRLFSECIERLKQTMPPDTVVDGWVADRDTVGFWRRYGFRFEEAGGGLFMACTLHEIGDINEKERCHD